MITLLYLLGLTLIGVYGEYDGVAFTVGHTAHIDVNDNFTVPFSKVITGHRAQPTNGVFTCPQSGLYEFQVYALTKSDTRLFLEIYHNDKLVASLWAHVALDYAAAGNTVILNLTESDTVQVKTRGNYHTVTYGSADQIYTTFTGIQLGAYAYGEENELTAFSTSLVNHQDVAGGSPVIYDTVNLNKGPDSSQHVYNQSTGTFVAPSGGIYVFHFFSLARQDQELWQELFHNDNYVCSLYGKDASDYADAGNTVILHLKQGDRVQIRAHPSRPNSIFGSADQIYSTFSGYQLLHDDGLDSTEAGPKAYFSAGLTQQKTFQDGDRIVYDQVFTDHGTNSHYDHTTGEFTAPYAGTYEFNYHALGQNGAKIWLELHHNYRYINSLYSHVPAGYSSAGNAAVVEMDAGDVVYVRARNSNALFGSATQIYCTFSGALIHSKNAYTGGTNVIGK